MKILETPLKDAFLIEAEPFEDNRGLFARIFCKKELMNINNNKEIVQINQSITKKKGSIRGMHYQISPFAEAKIVKCIKGRVYDVIIDLRKDSPTFLQHFPTELSKKNMKMIYVPEGFAHGFQTLEDNCELIYFHTNYYSAEHEKRINCKDNILGIKWPIEITDISEKDKKAETLEKNYEGIEL